MFKTFLVVSEDDCSVADLLEKEISIFLKNNPNLKEIHRSAPTTAMSPIGSYNSGFMISIAVTCEFKETYQSAFK